MNTDQITDFLRKQNVFTVIGVSSNPAKYGHQIYKDLKEVGYVVYAVNPNIDTVSGDRCYHSLSELPEKPDVVDVVVPPKVTEKIVVECRDLGLKKSMDAARVGIRACNIVLRSERHKSSA